MNRYAHAAGHIGNFLALENSIADCNAGFSRFTDMLL